MGDGWVKEQRRRLFFLTQTTLLFSLAPQSTEYAAHIRNAFQSAGLAGALRSLPIDDLFALDAVKSVVRTSDGFQPHLVSPEAGLRRLVSDALALADAPVAACVHRIHAVLVGAAREAASKASLLTDASTLDPKRAPLVLPAFEAAVITAATRALEGWRDDALRVARTVVDMERSYVTAAFFRQRALERVAEDDGRGSRGRTTTAADDTDSDDGGPGLARASAAPPPPPARLPGGRHQVGLPGQTHVRHRDAVVAARRVSLAAALLCVD